MRRNTIPQYMTLLTVVLLAACSPSRDKADRHANAESAPATAPAAAAAPKASANDKEDSAASAAATAAQTASNGTSASKQDQMSSTVSTYTAPERQFIRTANATFGVKDVYQSALAIEDAVSAQGGFVTRNHIGTEVLSSKSYAKGDGRQVEMSEYRVRGELTVRVPSNKTQEFLRAIASQIEFLEARDIEAKDVQLEILRQQLAAAREQIAQQDLGDAAKHGNTAQRIDAINARTDSQGSRDEAKLAQKEFADQVAFATINLTIYQGNAMRQIESVDFNAAVDQVRPSFWSRAWSAIKTGWSGILDVVVTLLYVWPLWLVLGLIFAGVRYLRQKGFVLPKKQVRKAQNPEDHQTS